MYEDLPEDNLQEIVTKAVHETIRYCVDNDILRDFLMEHHQDVEAIMMEYSTQEMVTLGYGMEMEKRGIDKGKAEGISIGKAEGCRLTEKKYKRAFNEELAAASGISEKQKTEIMENLKKFSSD